MIRTLLDPIFQSIGQMFSSITVRVGGRYVAVEEERVEMSQSTEHTTNSQRPKMLWNYARPPPQEWLGYV